MNQKTPSLPDDSSPTNRGSTSNIVEVICSAEEDHYRILVEQAPFYLFEIGLGGNILWANRAGLQFAGVSDVHAITGMAYASIVGRSAADHMDRWLHEAANGTTCHFEFSSGSTNMRHCKASLVPIT